MESIIKVPGTNGGVLSQWTLGKLVHHLLTSMLTSWMMWGGMSLLGNNVESTMRESGNPILACSAILVIALAVSFWSLCKSFVPVWMIRHSGLLRISFFSNFIACPVVLQRLDNTLFPGKSFPVSRNLLFESASRTTWGCDCAEGSSDEHTWLWDSDCVDGVKSGVDKVLCCLQQS